MLASCRTAYLTGTATSPDDDTAACGRDAIIERLPRWTGRAGRIPADPTEPDHR